MADKKNKIDQSKEELKKSKDELEKALKASAEDIRTKGEERYNRTAESLNNTRRNIEDRATADYRDARRYVRSNPEEGVVAAFAGGLVLGLCLGLMRR